MEISQSSEPEQYSLFDQDGSCSNKSQECCQQRTTPSVVSLLDCLGQLNRLCPAQRTADGEVRVLCLDRDMDLLGVSSTLNFSECPNDAKESSLLDILVTGNVPRKYYLSPKCCAGILRRAAKRGKELPAALKEVLEGEGFDGSEDGTGRGQPIVYENHGQDSRIKEVSVSPQINSKAGSGGGNLPLVMSVHQNASGDIQTEGQKGFTVGTTSNASARNTGKVMVNKSIRRLMPIETERLQGFPDSWTEIPLKGKAAELCPDSPRYKAIGNSWAVPVAAWIGKRIQEVDNEIPKTQAVRNTEVGHGFMCNLDGTNMGGGGHYTGSSEITGTVLP